MCCNNVCVATYNDPQNCGTCGHTCSGSTPFCNNGSCVAPPACMVTGGQTVCTALGETCCGTYCCAAGQICCNIDSNVAHVNPQCATPENGTCPIGCPGCP